MTLPAHAKVNLRLRVFSRDEGGYHTLETIFLRLDLHDTVEISESDRGMALELEGDAAAGIPEGPDNLCWRAAAAFQSAVGERAGLLIRLHKRIPAGAGLGGGSADAAAVLRFLNQRARRPLSEAELLRLGGQLGSDVPFALLGVPMALGWERGRRLLPLQPPSPRSGLVLVPRLHVATRDAYAWLREHRRASTGPTTDAAVASIGRELESEAGVLPGARRLAEWETLARLAQNDFERPLFARHPELEDCRQALREAGAIVAQVTGSGSALFGVFHDSSTRADAADRMRRSGFDRESGWLVLEARLPV
jgi:4-diphosphocytidyl-2-C-methyl-D-erythritol kinase